MTTITTEGTPRVWIGCLDCYGSGRLVGEWYDAEAAEAVTVADVHRESGTPFYGDEELWCMDHEHLPISGECSPMEAAEWGRFLADVDDWQRSAVLAWVRAGDYSHNGHGVPDVSEFEDAYAGEWASFREYAENLADDIGLLHAVPDGIAAYFDWEAWSRDLAYDYTTEPAPGSGVYVFHSL